MKGIILNKNADGFNVLLNEKIINCKARGVIKTTSTLQAGDEVKVESVDNDYVITKMFPRKNSLIRPYISNIDQLIIVMALLPKPDYLLIDKLIIGCILNKIKPIIVVNKSDITSLEFFNEIVLQYQEIVKNILFVSVKENKNIDNLKILLKGKLSAFCGQSAVGKTSLINSIFGGLNLKTDELSYKTKTGKNTTRHTQIYVLNKNTLVSDTPGFNVLNFPDILPPDLKDFYLEFNNFKNSCEYNNCLHINEQGCAVIKAVNSGKINKLRYMRYTQLYTKLLDIWRKKYD